jgi:hypothetical protein
MRLQLRAKDKEIICPFCAVASAILIRENPPPEEEIIGYESREITLYYKFYSDSKELLKMEMLGLVKKKIWEAMGMDLEGMDKDKICRKRQMPKEAMQAMDKWIPMVKGMEVKGM